MIFSRFRNPDVYIKKDKCVNTCMYIYMWKGSDDEDNDDNNSGGNNDHKDIIIWFDKNSTNNGYLIKNSKVMKFKFMWIQVK